MALSAGVMYVNNAVDVVAAAAVVSGGFLLRACDDALAGRRARSVERRGWRQRECIFAPPPRRRRSATQAHCHSYRAAPAQSCGPR